MVDAHEVQVYLAVDASDLSPHRLDAFLTASCLSDRQLREDRQHLLLQHRPGGLNGLVEAAAERRDKLRRAERLHDLNTVSFVRRMVIKH